MENESLLLTTYPNPATNFLTCEYRILEEYSTASLVIMDARGRMIEEYSLTMTQDQKLIPLPSISDGLYQAVLMVDGHSHAASEFMVSNMNR